MSHATYAFLINVDDSQADQYIAAEVTETFASRYAIHFCDDNNWYQEQAVVLGDGRIIHLSPTMDWEDEEGPNFLAMPEEQRWDAARLLALQCALGHWDIERLEADDFDTLLGRAISAMPGKLAQFWERGLLKGVEAYEREQWSRIACALFDSVNDGSAPFAYPKTPYIYSAFDLRSDIKTANAILFVDIHV